MGVYKRGNSWWICFYDNGKRHREGVGPSKKKAEQVLQKRRVEVIEGKFFNIRKINKIGLQDFAKLFHEKHCRNNKLTWENDKYYIHNLVSFFGNTYLDKITTLKIEEFKDYRLKQGVKQATINRDLAFLRTMLNKAVEWGHLEKNPVKIKLYKEYRRDRFLEKEEIERLINACGEPVKAIVTFAVNTGMRKGEMLNLKWSSVDFTNGFIYIDRSKNKEKRVIPMNSVVKRLLLHIREHYISEYVFCGGDGKRVKTIRRGFASAVRKANITNLRFHDLRHTFAAHYLMAGGHIFALKEILGHKKIEMTMRYSHFSQKGKSREMEALGNRIATFTPHSPFLTSQNH